MLRMTVGLSPASGRRQRAALALLLPIAAACEGDNIHRPPLVERNELYWALELDQHAVTLSTSAPYDTLTVAAVPRNPDGAPLSGAPTPQYASTNVKRVLVTPEGLLVAVAPTEEPVEIVATLTVGNLQHADTALVRVVDVPSPALGSFSIHPVPPDSAKFGMIGNYSFDRGSEGTFLLNKLIRATEATDAPFPVVQVPDYGNVPVADLLVSFRISDLETASISSLHANVGGIRIHELEGHRVGTVSLAASTTVFGVRMADAIPFRIGWPVVAAVEVQPVAEGSLANRFVEPVIKVGTGANVFWGSITSRAATDVAFTDTDPTNIAPLNTTTVYRGDVFNILCSGVLPFWGASDCNSSGGSFVVPIPPLDAGRTFNLAMVGRVFPVPGTYEYHSAQHGINGRVIVVDER